MHRAAGHFVRKALARRPLPAFVNRSTGFPAVFRAEIRFSRVKAHEDVAPQTLPPDSPSAPPHPPSSSSADSPVAHSSAGSQLPVGLQSSGDQLQMMQDMKNAAVATPAPGASSLGSAGQSHVQRTRCPRGIIR